MDGHADDVFFDVGLSYPVVEPRPKPPLGVWKVLLCALLDARVYCNEMVKSISKAVELY
jgi:hypothetical protein